MSRLPGMGTDSALAAPLPPYALHYDLPYLKQRRSNRDRQTNYGIPLPPRVNASTVLIEQGDNPAPYNPSPRAEELRIITPRYAETTVVPIHHPPAADGALENRLAVQDRNIELLLDRAVRIKEDLVAALGRTNSGLQEERFARELLQQHVNVMVLLCQKLSQQIEFLWYEMQHREQGSSSAITNLRQLELAHVQNITDVKGKAENLELSLGHLGRDIKALADRGRYTEKQWESLMQQHLERYFGLDGKMATLATKVDANQNEMLIHLRGLDKDIESRFAAYEGQMRASLEQMRNELTGARLSMQNQIEQLDASFQKVLALQNQEFTNKLRTVEKNAFEAITLSGQQAAESQRRIIILEQRLKALEQIVADQVVNVIEPRFAEMKDEMQRMFRDVRDAIDNLEHVQDGKMRLLEDRVSKEVGELRKFVVLV